MNHRHRLGLSLFGTLAFAWLFTGCRPEPPPAAPPTLPPPARADAFPMTVTDALGQSVTLPQPPRRIVSLAPSLTEILFALNLGDRVVGVTSFCKYPPEAAQKANVGGYVNASPEKIVSLVPDAVFCTRGTPRPFMESLRGAGISVLAVDQTTYAQVCDSIEFIGTVCGVPGPAEKIAAGLRAVQQEITAKTAALTPDQRPRALLILSLQPLFVAGPGSFQHEMLQAAGATDVSGLQKPFGAMSEEAVVETDPQVLIFTSNDNGEIVTVDGQMKKLQASAAWQNVSAVKNRRVIVVNVDHLSVPGPRLGLGFRDLARQLHPELFAP